MNQYVIAIAETTSTTAVRQPGQYGLETSLNPWTKMDGTGRTEVYDSWDRAFEAWMNLRARIKEDAEQRGWVWYPHEEDEDDTLRLIEANHGPNFQKERLFKATVIHLPTW